MATNFIRAESPSKAEQKPVRHGSLAQPCAELSANQDLQNEIPIVLRKNQNYVNPPAGGQDANSAAPVDLSLAAIPTSNAAAQVRRNWADITEEVNPGAEEGFTLVQGRKRRRGSANSPTAAAPSSNPGGSRTIRRPQPSAGSVPRAQEIRVTRAHIAEARARQASSSEEHCVYIEHSPELEPFHYLRALDRMLGGTAGVIQITKVNGHQLLGLTNRGLAERLISEGLEVEGTLLRAFPFRKRAERITVGNLPFFVADSAVITALSPYGRVTSIAPKQMKAGPYVYVDGRRDVFITLHEGITIERLPTRLDINIKGQAWPAYLSSGIRCSRCHGQGHRRAICPLLAGLANNTRTAPPTTPAGVPPPTTPAPPQRSAAQPPAPTPSNPAMEVCSAPPVARAALHSSAPRPSPPAAQAFPMEETPPAPPPVTPAPSLQTPGSREPAAPTPDVEMSIVEETFASSTSSAKNATRVDLDAFIEGLPSVSFAKTDALGLGREEVLDLLSSRTKAQRKRPLLSPPQCDALVGLIGQILDLKPGHTSNLYKVLGQVKAELRTTPAVPPTPTLPAPWPAKPTPPALHGEKTSPDIATPPPPLSTEFIDACYDQANDIIYELSDERYLETLSDIGVTEGDIVEAIIFPDDREPLLRRLSTQKRTTLAGIVSAASERARSSDPFVREGLRILSEMLPPPLISETSAFLAETKDSWIADSGATDHMTFRREWFSTFEEIPEGVHPVCLGDGKQIYAKGGKAAQVRDCPVVRCQVVSKLSSTVVVTPGGGAAKGGTDVANPLVPAVNFLCSCNPPRGTVNCIKIKDAEKIAGVAADTALLRHTRGTGHDNHVYSNFSSWVLRCYRQHAIDKRESAASLWASHFHESGPEYFTAVTTASFDPAQFAAHDSLFGSYLVCRNLGKSRRDWESDACRDTSNYLNEHLRLVVGEDLRLVIFWHLLMAGHLVHVDGRWAPRESSGAEIENLTT
ncbi:hypothetical protein LAZ67_15002683 [Cordylochernes scorpioides]|uniref:Retrovirus-related Pol polyprotein from transposon TNT 1-94-like beta-barrel domain-containing protein n=1 Tax=Cordylochernes scorpioides TaxID=51811 RepID=A0ABY6LAL4_9ARAC|nr:hypothetical protein LAZ67_15002683 [Cordylochernes scorpioides]